MVLAGAFGNIIDSVFYGEIFSASYPEHVATVVPFEKDTLRGFMEK